MDGFELTGGQPFKPLAWLGFEHPFFTIKLSDVHTIAQTWLILLILLCLLIAARYFLRYKQSVPYFLTTSFVHTFMDMTTQTLGSFHFNHFAFITTLFIFILSCNSAAAIPWLSEPTSNINTTLALGILSFLYTQWYAIRATGLKTYVKSYLAPFFIMLPLNIIGKLSNIISISFRLFGNIFGGSMIGTMYEQIIAGSVLWETLGLFTGLNFVILFFFGLFEGFLQAFVFAMLSLTYLSIAVQTEETTTKETKR